MSSLEIEDVPEEVHAELRRRAAATGRTLQEYLLGLFIDLTRQPP